MAPGCTITAVTSSVRATHATLCYCHHASTCKHLHLQKPARSSLHKATFLRGCVPAGPQAVTGTPSKEHRGRNSGNLQGRVQCNNAWLYAGGRRVNSGDGGGNSDTRISSNSLSPMSLGWSPPLLPRARQWHCGGARCRT
ncbi:hypothetical protein E2C01_062215 [Portunus trituberculatus]|uniref:Uncharacterized protein n=1 Tax=Portunus trituberculatus TaxID=210409 RepID=A0A5B7HEI7_PORTR|nr:hypothetical protein [Portunus trituberculatus]